MARFDTSMAHSASEALSAFASLNRLDDLWTLYLREPGPVPAPDLATLTLITSQMRDVLGGIGTHATNLQRIIGQRRDSLNSAFASTLAATSLPDQQRHTIQQVVMAAGGFARFAEDQLRVLQEQSHGESQELHRKIIQIQQGGITQGDLRFRFKCALGVALLAGTLAMMVATGTILIPAVVAAVQGGAGAFAIVAAFVANGGGPLILEGTHAVVTVGHLVEHGCFKRSDGPR